MTASVVGSLTRRAVVWDMDGTLIDSASVVSHAFATTARELGGRDWPEEDIVALYSLGEPKVMLSHLIGRRATSEDVDLYHRHLDRLAAGVRVYPGIFEVLRLLAPRTRLGVFTGASERAARILLDTAGLSDFFATVVGGDTVGRPKPDPAGIHRACADLGVSIERAAYVGDAPADTEAALRSRVLAVAAGWGHQFRNVPQGAVLARTPADVLRLL